eukprot:1142141-Pelagomonas_calceolata.AAC.3
MSAGYTLGLSSERPVSIRGPREPFVMCFLSNDGAEYYLHYDDADPCWHHGWMSGCPQLHWRDEMD